MDLGHALETDVPPMRSHVFQLGGGQVGAALGMEYKAPVINLNHRIAGEIHPGFPMARAGWEMDDSGFLELSVQALGIAFQGIEVIFPDEGGQSSILAIHHRDNGGRTGKFHHGNNDFPAGLGSKSPLADRFQWNDDLGAR